MSTGAASRTAADVTVDGAQYDEPEVAKPRCGGCVAFGLFVFALGANWSAASGAVDLDVEGLGAEEGPAAPGASVVEGAEVEDVTGLVPSAAATAAALSAASDLAVSDENFMPEKRDMAWRMRADGREVEDVSTEVEDDVDNWAAGG